MIATGNAVRIDEEFDYMYDPEIPNDVTLAAIEEVEEMMKHPDDFKSYTDVHQMFADLLA